MTDTTLRQLKLLELLPRQPFKKSPQILKDELTQKGFEVSIRTIQRDLKVLSSILPLISDERDKPYGWSWHHNAPGLNPAMDPIEALTLSLAEQYLKPLMPIKNYKRLEVFFNRANQILDKMPKSKINNWRQNVKVVPTWQQLLPPSLKVEVEEGIYDAILNQKQLEVAYKNRGEKNPKKRTINPLGLVLQGSIHRIICTMQDDEQLIRNLPLHRFMNVKENGNPSIKPKDFDMDKFIDSENLSFLISKKPIYLKLKFSSFAGYHLQETPVSNDQKIRDLGEGQMLVEAEVKDTSQLRWWLLGFGADVEIIKPRFLREEFKATANSLKLLYLD